MLTEPALTTPRPCETSKKINTSSNRSYCKAVVLVAGALCARVASHVMCLLLGSSLRQYDFRAARVALVPSAPGTGKKQYKGADLHKYGHMRVRALLSQEQKKRSLANLNEGGHKIVLQFTSLASLSSNPVREGTELLFFSVRRTWKVENTGAYGSTMTVWERGEKRDTHQNA